MKSATPVTPADADSALSPGSVRDMPASAGLAAHEAGVSGRRCACGSELEMGGQLALLHRQACPAPRSLAKAVPSCLMRLCVVQRALEAEPGGGHSSGVGNCKTVAHLWREDPAWSWSAQLGLRCQGCARIRLSCLKGGSMPL